MCVRGVGGRGKKGGKGLIAIAGDDGREIGLGRLGPRPAPSLDERLPFSRKEGTPSIFQTSARAAHVEQVGWMAVAIAIGLVRSRSRAMKNLSHFESVGRRPRMRN